MNWNPGKSMFKESEEWNNEGMTDSEKPGNIWKILKGIDSSESSPMLKPWRDWAERFSLKKSEVSERIWKWFERIWNEWTLKTWKKPGRKENERSEMIGNLESFERFPDNSN